MRNIYICRFKKKVFCSIFTEAYAFRQTPNDYNNKNDVDNTLRKDVVNDQNIFYFIYSMSTSDKCI